MNKFNYLTLSQLQGQTVSVKDQKNQCVELVVAAVNKGSMDGERWESFATSFTGSPKIRIPQGTYTFEHPLFGSCQLFLSPLSETEYEAVINRERHSDSAQ